MKKQQMIALEAARVAREAEEKEKRSMRIWWAIWFVFSIFAIGIGIINRHQERYHRPQMPDEYYEQDYDFDTGF